MNRKHVGSKYSPPWQRRGGRDINKNGAKPPLMERTGWLVQLPIIRWFERTTPSAPIKEASLYLISGAATPPSPRRGLALPETFGNRLGQNIPDLKCRTRPISNRPDSESWS